MIVRPMKDSEIDQAAFIEKQNFTDPWSQNGIAETLSQKQSVILVAVQEEMVLGYLIAYHVLDEGEIARIAVLKKYQNQGVGGRLLAELEILCRQKGISKLMLDVRSGNKTAEHFYRKHGFAVDGCRRSYYTEPIEDAVLMSREIN